jgi:putative transposase
VTRFSIYSWQRQAELHAQGKAKSSPVTGSDEDAAAVRDQKILKEWRAHPGLGPSQVRNQLRRQGMKVSMHTVRCVLEENGYVSPKIRRVEAHDQRYEAVRPNHLWHLDFLHRHIHKQKVYLLLVLDDYSRFIVGGALWEGERVAAVMETFNDAVQRHGKPEKVMSDGGSAFYAWKGVGQFTKLLEEYEIDQIIAKTPQVNGKLEVLNANVAKELFNQETFFDLGEAARRLAAWIRFYNFRRTHHALGGLLVPADRYFGRADEVLAKIESGGSPDGVDEPAPVGERQLDIFRVTSHRGQVELHLLGHRIPLPVTSLR